jgi:uncharacterized SAM-binding protein YcdF (DUF218 family)
MSYATEHLSHETLALSLGLLVVVTMVCLAGPTLLRALARVWVVSDPLARADLVLVPGGGLDVRPSAAADLYRRGFASRIAIARSEFNSSRDAELARDKFLEHGVPSNAIVEFLFSPHSTYGEACGFLL